MLDNDMIHRGIFTPERLAAVETSPALLKQQGVKAHTLIPDSNNRRSCFIASPSR
jgi:hypothetical protein